MLHTRVLRIDPLTQHSTAGSDTDAGANIGHSAQSNAQTSRAQCDQQWQHGLKWRVLTEPCSIPQTAVEAAAAAAGGQEPAAKQTQEDSTQQGSSQQQEWVFDAVASCVGIFSEISLPQVRAH
jgi:hypothetical protein